MKDINPIGSIVSIPSERLISDLPSTRAPRTPLQSALQNPLTHGCHTNETPDPGVNVQ